MTPSLSSKTSSSAEWRPRSQAAGVFVGCLAVALGAAAAPSHAASPRPSELLLERPYPIIAYASFPGGLFHWIDSLAGTSAGKTIPAHREDYLRRFGPLSPDDERHLRAFVTARTEHVTRLRGPSGRDAPAPRTSAMLGTFCRAGSLDEAMRAVRMELSAATYAGLAEAMVWFDPKYREVWNDGIVPRAFLENARRDPGIPKLEALLANMVRFYAVDPALAPPPRVALVPVPNGYGTHAEAIGDVLLLEIRPVEGLADEASVLVHENAHFLWGLVAPERKRRLAEYMDQLDATAASAWKLFGEAIPTALGQGVADAQFRPDGWSLDAPWYHRADVDVCAKRIFPAVRYALAANQPLDEAFLRRTAGLLNRSRGLIPRSP